MESTDENIDPPQPSTGVMAYDQSSSAENAPPPPPGVYDPYNFYPTNHNMTATYWDPLTAPAHPIYGFNDAQSTYNYFNQYYVNDINNNNYDAAVYYNQSFYYPSDPSANQIAAPSNSYANYSYNNNNSAGSTVLQAYDASTCKNYALFPLLPSRLDPNNENYVSATANYAKFDFDLQRAPGIVCYDDTSQQRNFESRAAPQSNKGIGDYTDPAAAPDFCVVTGGLPSYNVDDQLCSEANNAAYKIAAVNYEQREGETIDVINTGYSNYVEAATTNIDDDVTVLPRLPSLPGSVIRRNSALTSTPRRKYSTKNPILTQFTVKYLKEIIDSSAARLNNSSGCTDDKKPFYVSLKSNENSKSNSRKRKFICGEVEIKYDGASSSQKMHIDYADPNLDYSISDGSSIQHISDLNDMNSPLLKSGYPQNGSVSKINFSSSDHFPADTSCSNDYLTALLRADMEKPRSPKPRICMRNRCYDFKTLQIGEFRVRDNSSRNKLRFYYAQNQIVYDFECEYSVVGSGPVNWLVVVIIPLSIVHAIDFRSKKLVIQVKDTPRIISGFNRDTLPDVLKGGNFDTASVDVTDGQISSPFHLITLPRAQGSLIEKHFYIHYPEFTERRIDIPRYRFLTDFVDETPAIELVRSNGVSTRSSSRRNVELKMPNVVVV